MSGYYVMIDMSGDDVLLHQCDTLEAAVEARNAEHARQPDAVLSICEAGGKMVQPPRTLALRQQFGDGMPGRRK